MNQGKLKPTNYYTYLMKIGILGTRGIPNAYGGLEQFAQYLSVGLLKKGHAVWVYNSNKHPYQQSTWNGVHIIHCKDLEHKIGTAGQFIYDYNCYTDARKRDFDVLLQLGYSSSSIWYFRWPKTINIVNMDGLEWKRTKYNKLTRSFLKLAERLAAEHADVLIADSPGIQSHLQTTYNKESVYIPYAAKAFPAVDERLLQNYILQPKQYFLVIARMEAENNIEMIINGYLSGNKKYPLILVGNYDNRLGKLLHKKYADENLRFVGSIYDQLILNTIRHYSAIYFHGHSVGGTNPSLIEAMASECNIAAHDNLFNRAVLDENAEYFLSAKDVAAIVDSPCNKEHIEHRLEKNIEKVKSVYNWDKVIDDYEKLCI